MLKDLWALIVCIVVIFVFGRILIANVSELTSDNPDVYVDGGIEFVDEPADRATVYIEGSEGNLDVEIDVLKDSTLTLRIDLSTLHGALMVYTADGHIQRVETPSNTLFVRGTMEPPEKIFWRENRDGSVTTNAPDGSYLDVQVEPYESKETP